MSRGMSCTYRIRTAVPLAFSLVLSACGGDSNDPPAVRVTDLKAGTYAVSSGDAGNPTAGKYYAAADGSRLLVLNNGAQQATAIYRRDADSGWQMTPAHGNAALELLNSSQIPSHAVTLAAVANSYLVRLATGAVAAFAVTASGDIVAGNTACKLSGKLATTALPDSLKVSLTTSGCGDLPAQSDGFLVMDTDYSPAAFRLLTSGGSVPVDLWAFSD
jgi:hypothetical protein